jgi:hypothetical protein
MQTVEGYFENGRFFDIGQTAYVPERRRVIITIPDEPAQPARCEDIRAWLDKFHRLAASDGEELSNSDFPRMRFGRGLVDLSEGD